MSLQLVVDVTSGILVHDPSVKRDGKIEINIQKANLGQLIYLARNTTHQQMAVLELNRRLEEIGMGNTSPVTECPTCKSNDIEILNQVEWILTLGCHNRHSWKTLSKTCTNCKKPNGYLHKGVCVKCYKLTH